MADSILLFLLLLLAAVSGWWIGRRQGARRQRQGASLSSHYFRGLNHLLNEDSDKAIEAFTRLAEINRDTVDTHLALGTLFRRRGEMDKAIGYHKHIISRPNLSEEQREGVLFELGLDYMRSGLLDRAERLFLDLSQNARVAPRARQQLLDIYLQTKDWARAIEQAQALQPGRRGERECLIGQLYCELAQSAVDGGDCQQARAYLRQARSHEPDSARARLIEAAICFANAEYPEAAALFRDACALDPDLLVSHFAPLLQAHQQAGQRVALLDWLLQRHEASESMAPALAWARLRGETDPQDAADFLLGVLERRPTVRGLELLMCLLCEHELGMDALNPALIRDLMQRLIKGQPVFRCRQCGYSASSHHWMCPGCRSWNTIGLIQGPFGE